MFLMSNKENSIPIRTLIWRPGRYAPKRFNAEHCIFAFKGSLFNSALQVALVDL